MLDQLLHALSGDPERQRLFDAVQDDNLARVQTVLMDAPDHAALLNDAFLTPLVITALENGCWRAWKGLTEFGYSLATKLKPQTEPPEETPVGHWAAAALSPEGCAELLEQHPDWDPWVRQGERVSPASYGVLFGNEATFAFWLQRLKEASTEASETRHRQRVWEILTAVCLLERAFGPKDPARSQILQRRLGRVLHQEMGPPPAHGIPEYALAIAARSDPEGDEHWVGRAVGLLRWAVNLEPTSRDRPLEQEAARNRQWSALAALLDCGWTICRPIAPKEVRHCLLAALAPDATQQNGPGPGWQQAWNRWHAVSETADREDLPEACFRRGQLRRSQELLALSAPERAAIALHESTQTGTRLASRLRARF